ncbi:Hypothetical protein NocV09_02000380 [Nannochloropsis oceanica]
MGKVFEGQCVSGAEVLWVAVHGFGFALALLTVGTELLHPRAVTAVVAAGGTYFLVLSELTAHSILQEWAPLVAAVLGAGLLSMGGARFASGQSFAPPSLSSGAGPVIILSVLAGYVLAAFQMQALGEKGLEDWIPLAFAAGISGLLANAGAYYSPNEDFFPKGLTSGAGPRMVMLGLGLFVGPSFLGALESHKGTWEQWLALAAAAAGSALFAFGGARYAQGFEFFPEALTRGPVPAAGMALLAAFIYTSFVEHFEARKPGEGVEQWMPLLGAVVGAGVLSHCGARWGAGEAFLPALLESGAYPLVATAGLVIYTVLALHAVNEPKGGLTMLMNLAGAASVVGALSALNKRKFVAA